MNKLEAAVREVLPDLEEHCLFDMCDGSGTPPVPMLTCVLCSAVWTLRNALS